MPNKNKKLAKNKADVSLELKQSLLYSSPLPPPEILEKYDLILPNASERFLSLVEKQTQHRMELEKEVIESKIKDSRLGIILGFILGLFGLGIAALLIYNDKSILGFSVIITEIVGLVGVFIYGTKSNKKERENKEKINRE